MEWVVPCFNVSLYRSNTWYIINGFVLAYHDGKSRDSHEQKRHTAGTCIPMLYYVLPRAWVENGWWKSWQCKLWPEPSRPPSPSRTIIFFNSSPFSFSFFNHSSLWNGFFWGFTSFLCFIAVAGFFFLNITSFHPFAAWIMLLLLPLSITAVE